MADELESLLNQAFGAGKIQITLNENKLSLFAANSKISLNPVGKDNSEALDYLGFDYGSSNRINLNTKIEDLKLANPLATQEFEFTINGVNFSFSGNNT